MKTGPGRLMRCPHCGFDAEFGVGVCQGCGAEVVYGTTFRDWREAWALGTLGGLGAAWLFGPTPWWGYLALAVAGMIISPVLNRHLRGKVRFFRRYERDYNRSY